MILIEDPADPRIAPFRWRDRALNTRADRRERVAAGMFVAEGDLVVGRALDAGCEPVMAFVDAADVPVVVNRFDPSVEVYGADVDVRRAGMGLGVPLSIVALFRRPEPVDAMALSLRQRTVALEAVDNPVNVGTVVRSAAALGWDGLLLDRTSGDPLARRALRVSMGNTFALRFARAGSLVDVVTAARERGTLVVALTPAAGSMPLEAVLPAHRQAVMLVLGSERAGLSRELLDAASVHASIPMAGGIDSMNAAAAAAVACYALRPIRIAGRTRS
ncbi:MAG: putative methyltransferase [Ilumatobacteraceae bacterium]|nr:putative methyltransferase [Ilumatobacteraceae bacterium]